MYYVHNGIAYPTVGFQNSVIELHIPKHIYTS
uniref:Uncharacterized protein n=1 Tax=Dulem virus 42 TaxID=3145760 RepID=A0AAU8BA83_9CAUD